jgi:hypothetical protein
VFVTLRLFHPSLIFAGKVLEPTLGGVLHGIKWKGFMKLVGGQRKVREFHLKVKEWRVQDNKVFDS